MEEHIRELQKEGKKVNPDRDKLVRLQSDSYVLREKKMCDLASNARPQETFQAIPFLQEAITCKLYHTHCPKPMRQTLIFVYIYMQLMQDMFHAISADNRFSSKADVVDRCTNVFKFWKDSLLPAILMYAEETNLSVSDDDDLNSKHVVYSCMYMYTYMHGYVVNLFFSLCLCIQISADNVHSEDATQQFEAKGK